jgi:cytochrome c oxidase assembly protein subunit 15
MFSRLRERTNGFTLSPGNYRKVAYTALVALWLIVLTGAAVRLTGSGLGCPDWPKCHGGYVAPLRLHAWIEYGNRLLSGFVALAAIAAGLLAWRRRPFRWELALFGALLPIGVIAQAGLGALTVANHLAPGFVMAHYILSMVILDAAFALAWCSTYEPGERRRSTDRLGVWAVRCLLPLGALTIAVGTAVTAAGPHAGGAGTGDVIQRLDFRGDDTLAWLVTRHAAIATVFLIAVLAVIALLLRPGGYRWPIKPLGVLAGILIVQATIGIVQYKTGVPAELVWFHILFATLAWLAVLWSVGRAGRLDPRTRRPPTPETAG